jgi:phosphatidylinositol alpha-1,6-mannosyltransferase
MILHSFDYPPCDGGISRLCAEIAAGFCRRGVDVRALTQAASTGVGSQIPEVPVSRVTARRPWREWAAWRRLRRGSWATPPVICAVWYPEGLLAMLAGVRPRVILAHGNELMPTTSRWRRGIWRHLQRLVLTTADLVVADSEYSCLLARSSAPYCRAVAVPLAVDHHRFSPGDRLGARAKLGLSDDHLVLCTVARIQAYKGFDVIFKALAGLPPSVRERFVHLIAGRGPDLEILRERAREMGVDSLVRWLGYVPEDDLPNLYRAADLFALCTRETHQQEVEGFGLAFLEAQACGTPAVGTRSGGIPDAISHGEGGWLIDSDDASALAEILHRLDDDPESFRRAGVAARARVERECTWDHYLRRFEAALEGEGLSR